MQRFNGQLINQFPNTINGNAAAGAQVTIRVKSSGALATLYATNSTGGTTLPNPLTADSKGYYGFYAPDGVYTLDVSIAGTPQLEIQLQDVAALQAQFDGALANAGYIPVGTFAIGCTVSQANGVVSDGSSYWRWDGALPKTVTAGSAPVPTGVGNWILVGDGALKNDLAPSSSTVLVGGVQAGELAETAANAHALSVASTGSIGKSSGVTLIDLHYGAMRGRGLTSAETTSDTKGGYNLSAVANAGQRNIVLTANTSEVFDIPLVVGQLVAYLATDGEYYSASIASISGTSPATVTLNSDIEVSIAAGRNLFAFMSNESHPIFYGYRAIADYALRKAKTQHQKIINAPIYAANSATLSVNSANDYSNCGSSSVLAYNVTMPTANADGVSASFTALETGSYMARVVINTNGYPIRLGWENAGLSSSRIVNCNDVTSFDLPISVRGASDTVDLFISSTSNSASINILGQIQIFKVTGATPNLSACKHVLLGDSWFAQTGVFERLKQRLPLADIVNKGVGGNTAVQLLNRFDTDVTPEKPDVVWIMVGTNDYYQSVSNDLFNFYVNQLVSKCAEIGAHLMIFNASAGSAPFGVELFNRSKQLANLTNYVRSPSAQTKKKAVFNIQRTVIPNGASQYQIINFGIYVSTFKITSYWFSAGTLTVGSKTGLNNEQNDPVTLVANSYETTDVNLSFSGGRYIDLRAANSSGSDVVLYGYIEVELP